MYIGVINSVIKYTNITRFGKYNFIIHLSFSQKRFEMEYQQYLQKSIYNT